MQVTIKAARVTAGFTQGSIAKKLNMDRGTYAKIEKDPRRATVGQIGEISRLTGVSVTDLFLPFDSTFVE